MPDKRFLRAAAGAACTIAALGAATSSGAGASPATVIGSGPDYVYGQNALSNARATVSAADRGADTSQLALVVTGVAAAAGTEFGAHLHTSPCGELPSAAGGHYVDPDAGGSLRHREVWLDFVVDGHGRGRAVATRDWAPTNRADRSVVIHVLGTDHETGAAGSRLACIDLDS